MLEDYAGKSRTLIRKFEDVADTVNYTFALMTADDTVQKAEEDYDQARPNVLFELGWFRCKLTRSGVCLLFQKNTKIPSDLEGIERLEFDKSVKEQHAGIQAELKSAGLISVASSKPKTVAPARISEKLLYFSAVALVTFNETCQEMLHAVNWFTK